MIWVALESRPEDAVSLSQLDKDTVSSNVPFWFISMFIDSYSLTR